LRYGFDGIAGLEGPAALFLMPIMPFMDLPD